jgi:hypothetical protein
MIDETAAHHLLETSDTFRALLRPLEERGCTVLSISLAPASHEVDCGNVGLRILQQFLTPRQSLDGEQYSIELERHQVGRAPECHFGHFLSSSECRKGWSCTGTSARHLGLDYRAYCKNLPNTASAQPASEANSHEQAAMRQKDWTFRSIFPSRS